MQSASTDHAASTPCTNNEALPSHRTSLSSDRDNQTANQMKYFGGVMTLTPGKEKEVDGRSIERESIGGSIGYG